MTTEGGSGVSRVKSSGKLATAEDIPTIQRKQASLESGGKSAAVNAAGVVRLKQPQTSSTKVVVTEAPLTATKVICTIGPSSCSREVLSGMLDAGMAVARFNSGFRDSFDMLVAAKTIRELAEAKARHVCLLLDLAGFQPRLGNFGITSPFEITSGSTFTLYKDREHVGTKDSCSVNYPQLFEQLSIDQTILLDDGKIGMEILEITEHTVVCKATNSGMIRSRCAITASSVTLTDLPPLTEQDKLDVAFGVSLGVNAIMATARHASLITSLREQPDVLENSISVIATISDEVGLENLDQILPVCDGICLNRGALGTRIQFSKVAAAQKMVIEKCNEAGKPIIVTSQMLDSMASNPRPTRAETTDVANAVWDGADACMLSAETAIGTYPVVTTLFMSKVLAQTESEIDFDALHLSLWPKILSSNPPVGEAIANSGVKLSTDLKSSCLIVLTETGVAALRVAKFRPKVPILAITAKQSTASNLMLVRGVIPYLTHTMKGDSIVQRGFAKVKELGICAQGDLAVVVSGVVAGVSGQTNMIHVVQVP